LTKHHHITARPHAIKKSNSPLAGIKKHLDEYLDIEGVKDWDNAWNGLQIENSGAVTKIGAAVDACAPVIEAAAGRGVDLLLVHHGLFWRGVQRFEGPFLRKIKTALDNNLAIYSAHLPLDVHPKAGNNALLCAALGFKRTKPFFFEKGRFIGLQARCSLSRSGLVARLEKALGAPVHVCPGGPARVSRVGVVTGGAGGGVPKAAAEGLDTFITGEGQHSSYIDAEELGINLLYGGHYRTETFGVKALAAHLSRRFALPWEFIEHPTGL